MTGEQQTTRPAYSISHSGHLFIAHCAGVFCGAGLTEDEAITDAEARRIQRRGDDDFDAWMLPADMEARG
ncbi:conserved protein of unknown function [Rhodovastum atsumiense]|uniref:Uncharacterized protein n=1 Tax=Rhodovastum atsumiense TaxID=504468 RepID=A0A5M6IZQ2_9PROT|nr:hypothetical protein [Rhodovastum atsumiense]KAA5613820.1 hypothetical protein F1189_03320 [Rhodovastum atsumiense]CAH2601921.1 conserved protein of unknown function [Rhodovastum atsumiense]